MRRNTATLRNSPGSKVWRAACTNELQAHLSKGKEKGKTLTSSGLAEDAFIPVS